MDIKEPIECDSIGKINEWLETCGFPQNDREGRIPGLPILGEDRASRIRHEEWGLGFRFEPTDRDAANKGYRKLCQHFAGAVWSKMMGANEDGYCALLWRIRPELREGDEWKTEPPEGETELDRDRYEDEDDDYRSRCRSYMTGMKQGMIVARMIWIPKE